MHTYEINHVRRGAKLALDYLRKLSSVFLLSLVLTSVAVGSSNNGGGNNNVVAPTELGPYKVGHTTMIVTDPTRNPNGAPGTQGRPLFLHIWYPSLGGSGAATQYSQGNPIYDGTHPPYPAVIFTVTFPSLNGAKEGLPVAPGKFPLIIHSHGSLGAAASGFPELKEILASQGYIVVSVEHSGNNASRDVANILGLANPSIFGAGVTQGIIRRSQDVSFTITQMLNSGVDPQLASHIDGDKIGLFGYSYGGGTTMITAAGLASEGFAPDLRVKAAIPMDGTDFVGFTASDYANVKIPMMLYQDADAQNTYAFPQLTNSNPKYSVDVAGALHSPAATARRCEYVQKSLARLEAVPTDLVTQADIQRFFSPIGNSQDIWAQCDASIFDGISDLTLSNLGILVDVMAFKPVMPLRSEVSLAEMERLAEWYVVSFFNTTLKSLDAYTTYLSNSKQNQKQNPLIDFAKNCKYTPAHLIDFKPGDKITFTPQNKNKYKVTFSSGNTLRDKGVNNLNLGDDDQVKLTLPFTFTMPSIGLVNAIYVSSNGQISTENSYMAGSPWTERGQLLLSGQAIIAALMKDLDPTAGGGVYARIESDQAVITWDAVPVYTDAGNGAPSTIQVVIHKNGVIDIITGVLANTGPDYAPGELGNIGIASGLLKASDLSKVNPVDFTQLTKPNNLDFGAIYEQFYLGAGDPSCKMDN